MIDNLIATADSLWRAEPFVPGRHVETPNGSLWVRDGGGTGYPVVMLHANTGTAESWQYQFGALAAAGLRPIAFDRPGKGCSLPGANVVPVAESIDALAKALDLDRFALAGVAGGAFVAIDYAAAYRARVSHLMLFASTGQFAEPEIDEAINRIEIPTIREQLASYRELGPSYRAQSPEGVEIWLAIHDHSFAQSASASPRLISPNRYEKLQQLVCPLRIVAGGADLIAPPSLMRLWVDQLTGSVLHIIAEAGHAPQWEAPDQASAHIIALIEPRS